MNARVYRISPSQVTKFASPTEGGCPIGEAPSRKKPITNLQFCRRCPRSSSTARLGSCVEVVPAHDSQGVWCGSGRGRRSICVSVLEDLPSKCVYDSHETVRCLRMACAVGAIMYDSRAVFFCCVAARTDFCEIAASALGRSGKLWFGYGSCSCLVWLVRVTSCFRAMRLGSLLGAEPSNNCDARRQNSTSAKGKRSLPFNARITR